MDDGTRLYIEFRFSKMFCSSCAFKFKSLNSVKNSGSKGLDWLTSNAASEHLNH